MINQIKSLVLCSATLSAAISCGTPVAISDKATEDYLGLISILGDSSKTKEAKYRASRTLSQGDIRLVPLLINALTDERVFDPKAVRPIASINAPYERRTVGMECEDILYQVIGVEPGLGGYSVSNWAAWWTSHKHLSLPEIRAEVARRQQPFKE